MCCDGVNRFCSSSTYLQGRDAIEYGVSYVALAIIAACGLTLVVCSAISYLPPNTGYWGGAFCISSLILFAILSIGKRCSVSKNYQNPFNFSDVGQAKSHSFSLQRTHVVPDEIYSNVFYLGVIFNILNGNDLTRVSQVCKQWKKLTADDQLWRKMCFSESILPPEGLMVPSSYKNTYRNSRALQCCLQKKTYKFSVLNPPKNTRKFLKHKNYFFLYRNPLGYAKKMFEVWDSSLRIRYSNIKIKCVDPVKVEIKLTGQNVCFIERELGATPVYIHRFNLVTNKFLTPIRFKQKEDGSIANTAFELAEDRAFIGQKDGGIVVWDLKQKSRKSIFDPPDAINYPETSLWSEKDEQIWNDSYDRDKMEKIKQKWATVCPWRIAQWAESNMEAGEFQRSCMNSNREYHQTLQKRIWLKGHTKEILSLRAMGPFLFSASKDNTIKQWDVSRAQCVRTIETGFKYEITSFHVAGQYVFGQDSHTICQWDFVTGECLSQINLKEYCLSFKIVGNLLFCLCGSSERNSRAVEIYSLSSKTCNQKLLVQWRWDDHMQIIDNCLYLFGEECILKWDFSHLK